MTTTATDTDRIVVELPAQIVADLLVTDALDLLRDDDGWPSDRIAFAWVALNTAAPDVGARALRDVGDLREDAVDRLVAATHRLADVLEASQ